MSLADNETAEEPLLPTGAPGDAPGLLALWSYRAPLCLPRLLPPGDTVTIGRSPDAELSFPDDPILSRRHAEIVYLAGGWFVRDLGSKHGTFVDGARIDDRRSLDEPAIVRCGHTILPLVRDVARYDPPTAIVRDYVIGPGLRDAFAEAESAARAGDALLVRGETGTGKERIARAFHERGPRARGPFVVVNAANVKKELAESELFGTRKGAFSGALDHEGLIARAHGGTLFFDELGELPLDVRAKLLRVFEQKEIHPVGAHAPRAIDFALCAATNVDLDAALERGTFRRDLLARVAQRTVWLDPLRDRRDEIPFLVSLLALDTPIDARFVEEALLRAWPANVRDLQNAMRTARAKATARPAAPAGRGYPDVPGPELLPTDLPPRTRPPTGSVPPPEGPEPPPTGEDLARRAFLQAWREANGDARAAMQALGMSKSTFYDKLRKYGLRLR